MSENLDLKGHLIGVHTMGREDGYSGLSEDQAMKIRTRLQTFEEREVYMQSWLFGRTLHKGVTGKWRHLP